MEVVAAVIHDGPYVLACRRAGHKSLAGKWEFPGGKVEIGESDRSALERELLEELNCQISVGSLLATSRSYSSKYSIEMRSYLCELSGSRPIQSSDHDMLVWLALDELLTLDWAELDIPVVEKLLATAN